MKLLHIQDNKNGEYIATFEMKTFTGKTEEKCTTVDLAFLQFSIANNGYLISDGDALLLTGIKPRIFSFIF